MWCSRCQQEVPAARGLSGPPNCVRCRGLLLAPSEARTMAAVSDCGVELDAFNPIKASPTAPRTLAREVSDHDLRRYQRLLRPLRWDDAHRATSLVDAAGIAIAGQERYGDAGEALAPRLRTASDAPSGVNLLLYLGCAALFLGVALLVVANILVHPFAWRWGFAVTAGSEGLLTAAIAALALRLWRNSRRINQQLVAVDHRLAQVHSALVESTDHVTASSLRNALRRIDAGGLTLR
jgi:hypothetical protein